jgi:hypothetical protein
LEQGGASSEFENNELESRGRGMTQLDRIEEKLDRLLLLMSSGRGRPVTLTHDKVLIEIATKAKFTVGDVAHCGPAKQVYNVLGYLTRRGRISRIGYGKYETTNPPSESTP